MVAAMADLVEDNIKLVWSIARKFMGRGYELEDLYQTGCLGLVKAADKFDESLGNQFSTYAVPVITGEILRLFRDDGAIKVSRSLKSTAVKVNKVRMQYEREHGREPTILQLEEMMNICKEEIAEAMNAASSIISLDKPVDDSAGCNMGDMLESGGWGSEKHIESRMMLHEILTKLHGSERKVLILRYICGKSQQEIADELGVNQVTVSRLEKKIKNNLKNEYNA